MINELNVMLTSMQAQDFCDVSQLLTHTAGKKGLNVMTSDFSSHTLQFIPSRHHLRFGDAVCNGLIRKGTCHVLLGFEVLQAARLAAEYLMPGGTILVNRYLIRPQWLYWPGDRSLDMEELLATMRTLTDRVITIEANALAKAVGDIDAVRYVLLGAAIGLELLPFSAGEITETLEELMVDERFRPVALKGFEQGVSAGMQIGQGGEVAMAMGG